MDKTNKRQDMKNNIPSLLLAFSFMTAIPLLAQRGSSEDDYYRLVSIPIPKDCVLEVGGLDWLDKEKKRLVVCTRRGEVWLIENLYGDQPMLAGQKTKQKNATGETVEIEARPEQTVRYQRMLAGLHEPLGLVVNPGRGFPAGIYMAQRGELTRVADTDGDDRIDVVQTFCNQWEISGSYHEYAFGPKLGKDGQLWVTLNRPFGGGQEATAYWRGWAVRVNKSGQMEPVCPGLRSPAGLGTNREGDMFYTDNQGDHVAVGKLSHLDFDTFQGNPVGLQSCEHPLATFRKPFEKYPKLGMTWGEAVKVNPKLRAPAIWFPYPKLGRSHTDVQFDRTDGKFGPFDGQLFVGDLSTAQLIRVFLERIGGQYQGACFPFRRGIQPPVLRFEWGGDGSLFVGGTSRGWGGGSKPYGLQRIVWTGRTPFEIHEMRAKPDGFELTFTKPVKVETAAEVDAYSIKAWTYNYYSKYGDNPQDLRNLDVTRAVVGKDRRSVRLYVSGLMPHYVHELQATGVRSAEGLPLLHADAYYTLNSVPKE